MNSDLIVSLTMDIQLASTVKILEQMDEKYLYLNHPFKFYLLGLAYGKKKAMDKAFECFVKAAELGINSPVAYLDTLHADSVGASIYRLLLNFSLMPKLDHELKYNLLANSYIFLSSTINIPNINTLESYWNRAALFSLENGFLQRDNMDLFVLGYLGFSISKVLELSDYYYGYIHSTKFGNIQAAHQCLENANACHEWLEDIEVAGKDADHYTLEEISFLGSQRHLLLYLNAEKDFLDDKFKVDINILHQYYN